MLLGAVTGGRQLAPRHNQRRRIIRSGRNSFPSTHKSREGARCNTGALHLWKIIYETQKRSDLGKEGRGSHTQPALPSPCLPAALTDHR
ncbi:hypothetical protein E2C01_018535 [Portunus trituberculatus]|uniref:Uncharacterized protein n=1 Tax=Portunus trituberculatus TaxID=210409 RepID=A0A5B7DVW3_PORTR|nr:hypothetical protein [Portunus trituberculatus]